MSRIIPRTITITVTETITIQPNTLEEQDAAFQAPISDTGVTTLCKALAVRPDSRTESSVPKKGIDMYASIRRYTTRPDTTAELALRVNQGFVPIISQAPGFVAYYVVDAGDNLATSITVFRDQAGVEESNRMAAD